MKKDEVLATLALLCNVLAFVIYNWQMLLGQSSPSAASWGIWAFVTVLNFTSYRKMSGDWVKSLLPTLSSVLCVLTFVIAISRGRLGTLDVYDAIVLAIGVVASVVWWRTKSPPKAQVLLQICIAIGFIPTYLSVWNNPENERLLGWLIWSITFTIQIVVVRLRWRGQKMDLLYPVNCAILHSAVPAIVLLGSK